MVEVVPGSRVALSWLLLSLRRSAVSDFPDTMITQGNKENEVWLIVEFLVL